MKKVLFVITFFSFLFLQEKSSLDKKAFATTVITFTTFTTVITVWDSHFCWIELLKIQIHWSAFTLPMWKKETLTVYTGQTFCDLPTHLHLFHCILHAIRINKCIFLVYNVILGIFWVTLSCKHMWGSVRVIWMILACATCRHFIYHPMWASCSELQYSKTWRDKNFKSNIHEYLTISWP